MLIQAVAITLSIGILKIVFTQFYFGMTKTIKTQ
jgi:hypothetical protein